jgi:biopolymer transport protein ExbB
LNPLNHFGKDNNMINSNRISRVSVLFGIAMVSAAMLTISPAMADDPPPPPPDTAPAPAAAPTPAPTPAAAPTSEANQPAPAAQQLAPAAPQTTPQVPDTPAPAPAVIQPPVSTSTVAPPTAKIATEPVKKSAKTAADVAAPVVSAPPAAPPISESSAPVATDNLPQAAAPTAAPVQDAPVAAATAPNQAAMLQQANEFMLPALLLVLVLMAAANWAIARSKRNEQDALLRQAEPAQKIFWSTGSVRQGANNLEQGSPFRVIADRALRASDYQPTGRALRINRFAWTTSVIQHAMDEVQGQLQSGLGSLSMLGSLGLCIGLLGAAWEMFQGMSGNPAQASIAQLVLPLGMALLSIALGFAVVIPAMKSRDKLEARNSECMKQVRLFCAELRKTLRGDSETQIHMPLPAAAVGR